MGSLALTRGMSHGTGQPRTTRISEFLPAFKSCVPGMHRVSEQPCLRLQFPEKKELSECQVPFFSTPETHIPFPPPQSLGRPHNANLPLLKSCPMSRVLGSATASRKPSTMPQGLQLSHTLALGFCGSSFCLPSSPRSLELCLVHPHEAGTITPGPGQCSDQPFLKGRLLIGQIRDGRGIHEPCWFPHTFNGSHPSHKILSFL